MQDHAALWYPALLHAHRTLVGISVGLFALRAVGVGLVHAWPMKPAVRHLSVLVDTLLMSAGVALWAGLQHNPLREPWLGLKLLLLLLYIVLGSFGLKHGATRASRTCFSALALLVVIQMYAIARWRDPSGLLNLWLRP